MRGGRGRGKKLTGSRRLRDWHRLAGVLGRSVGECRATVSEREFRHWREVFAREPDPVTALNSWMAQLLAMYASVHRGRGQPAVKAADLLPDPWGEAAEARRPARLSGKALFDAMAALAGGRPTDGG